MATTTTTITTAAAAAAATTTKRKPRRPQPVVAKSVRRIARGKRREAVANADRLAAVTDDRPVGKFIYLRPSVIRKVCLAAVDRDAALSLHKMSGEPIGEDMVSSRGVSGLIEQILVNWFVEREAEAERVLATRRRAQRAGVGADES